MLEPVSSKWPNPLILINVFLGCERMGSEETFRWEVEKTGK
jgi:hypothetical protein